eukprot:RCo044087
MGCCAASWLVNIFPACGLPPTLCFLALIFAAPLPAAMWLFFPPVAFAFFSANGMALSSKHDPPRVHLRARRGGGCFASALVWSVPLMAIGKCLGLTKWLKIFASPSSQQTPSGLCVFPFLFRR